MQTLGSNWEKTLILGRGSVNMLIREVPAAVRVAINHSNFIAIVLFLCFSNTLFLFRFHFNAPLKSQLNWVFTVHCFQGRNFFCCNFSTTFIILRQKTSYFPWDLVFIGGSRFPVSVIVFEENDVKIRGRIGDNFKFYAAVALLCRYTYHGLSKKLILPALLVFIST